MCEKSRRDAEALEGVREHLIVLIAAGRGEDAARHWKTHMAKAGEFFLEGLAKTSVVDILEGEM